MLEKYRTNIDVIDTEIVRLLEKRYDNVSAIAQVKKEHNLDVLDTDREIRVLDSIRGKVNQDDYKEAIVETFNQIMMVSKEYQGKKQ